MIRVGVNPVLFLLNNATYVIEEEIHSGPYNKLANWDYTALITAMKDGSSNLYTAKACTHVPSSPILASFGLQTSKLDVLLRVMRRCMCICI